MIGDQITYASKVQVLKQKSDYTSEFDIVNFHNTS